MQLFHKFGLLNGSKHPCRLLAEDQLQQIRCSRFFGCRKCACRLFMRSLSQSARAAVCIPSPCSADLTDQLKRSYLLNHPHFLTQSSQATSHAAAVDSVKSPCRAVTVTE